MSVDNDDRNTIISHFLAILQTYPGQSAKFSSLCGIACNNPPPPVKAAIEQFRRSGGGKISKFISTSSEFIFNKEKNIIAPASIPVNSSENGSSVNSTPSVSVGAENKQVQVKSDTNGNGAISQRNGNAPPYSSEGWSYLSINKHIRYKVVITQQECEAAFRLINATLCCAVDCEGVNLSRYGRLCLLQIAMKSVSSLFLCDVYVFDMNQYHMLHEQPSNGIGNIKPIEHLCDAGLRLLLTSSKVCKVMHDCRGDSAALYYQCGLRLYNVFDTQQAAMIIQNLSNHERLSLNYVLKHYTTFNNTMKDEVSMLMEKNFKIWQERPLSLNLLEYAVQDVAYLLACETKMTTMMQTHQLEQLAKQSEAQITTNIDESVEAAIQLPSSPRQITFMENGERIIHDISLDDAEQPIAMHIMWPAPPDDQDNQNTEMDMMISVFPPHIASELKKIPPMTIIDICLDLGSNPFVHLTVSRQHLRHCNEVTAEDLAFVVDKIDNFSSDNRAGITKTLHRISALRAVDKSIIGLTARVGRAIYGPLERIADIVYSSASVLIIGIPGMGKTTVLREFARILSDFNDKRVMIVDTSNEIAGCGEIKHVSIGTARRIQVPTPSAQQSIMKEAVQNHTPEVLIVDEIGNSNEVKSMRSIVNRGVRLIATVHARSLAQLINNSELNGLLGGTTSVMLGDKAAETSGKKKSSQQRQLTPVFDIAIELTSRDSWLIHRNVAMAVDELLSKSNNTPSDNKYRGGYQAERLEVAVKSGIQVVTIHGENIHPHQADNDV